MADAGLDAEFARGLLQLDLPQSGPAPVGATAFGGDERLPGPGVPLPFQALPPAPDPLDREGRRIPVDPDIDPAGMVDHVTNPIGDRLVRRRVHKVMHANLFVERNPPMTNRLDCFATALSREIGRFVSAAERAAPVPNNAG